MEHLLQDLLRRHANGRQITTAAANGGTACPAADKATKTQTCTVKCCNEACNGCPPGERIINSQCNSMSSARAAGLSAALALMAAAALAVVEF